MRIDYAASGEAFHARPTDVHVRLHQTYGGSGGDPAHAAVDLAARFEGVWRHLREATAVLVLAGIGGGTDYGATLAQARQLSRHAVPCEVLAVVPFLFERFAEQMGERIVALQTAAVVSTVAIASSWSDDDSTDRMFVRCNERVVASCLRWLKTSGDITRKRNSTLGSPCRRHTVRH